MDKTERVYHRRRFLLLVVIAAVVAVGLFINHINQQRLMSQSSHQGLSIEEIEQDDSLVLAKEALGQLAVAEAVSRDDYSRDNFSSSWTTVGGCDMRNRILQRDLVDIVLDEDNCTVLSGVLERDPFTLTRIEFVRGPDTSGDIHIEHLVAVSDAWIKGAQDLSYEQRHRFYNDPLNLVAIDGPANMAKGDKDAADWLPPQEYQCLYIARQIAVKLKYELWVRPKEKQAMEQVLDTCPLQVLPVERGAISD